ncbi:MAG: protein kinase [Chloroflexi bacterium]|nr:protein kinase [Chloroflexota bacterium]
MSDIFISYVEEDADVVEPLARGLTDAGYSCWYYERSSLPGPSYLLQISQALVEAQAVVLVVSPAALESHQVDKEIDYAHECGKPFLPVLRDLPWSELQQRQPKWRVALGTSVAIPVPAGGVGAIVPRVIEGLRGLGVGQSQPQVLGARSGNTAASPSGAATVMPSQPLVADRANAGQATATGWVRTSELATFQQGRYRGLGRLGEGGKGVVYLCVDTLLGRQVAVKVLKDDLFDPDGLLRFQREVQATASLVHPNIVTVFDLGQEGSKHFLVVELMEGGDVDALIAAQPSKRLDAKTAVRIGEDVARAMEHLHRHGVLHRDVKPGNIWLTSDGRAKLGDFGLAFLRSSARLTRVGMLVGSVAYMAPDVALGRQADVRSDLYMLGASLYEMVTGRLPFPGDDPVRIIFAHINDLPLSPRRFAPDIPAGLEVLIMRLLSKDPEERPAAAAEVLEALEAVEQQLEGAPRTAALPVRTGEPPDRQSTPEPRFAQPLVGRERELALLRQRVDAALNGEGGLVFITGEAGIGKTRLASELRSYARARGLLWLEGRYAKESSAPFQPTADAIRAFLRTAPPATQRKVLQPYAAELARLVPEVAEPAIRIASLPAGLRPEDERARLFEAVAGFYVGVSREQPLVLFLDDLQWAPSLEPHHLTARLASTERLLLVWTYRDAELQEQPALAKTVLAMNRERLFQALPLKRLVQDEVATLVANTLGEEASAGLAHALYERTDGNPFFVEEVVRYLAESGAITLGDQGWEVQDLSLMQIPTSVKAVVDERIDRLGEATRTALTWAAVIGGAFPLAVLQAVCGLDEDQLSDIVDAAVAARVLTPRSSVGQEGYAFVDNQTRDVLYDSIGPSRRRRYHLKVGQALEQFQTRRIEEQYEALALHFLEGNDVERALKYSVEAGEHAFTLASWSRAAQHFETALELMGELPEDTRQQAQLLDRLAYLDTLLGRSEVRHCEQALELYTKLGEAAAAARIHDFLAAAWFTGTAGRVDFDKCLPHMETAFQMLAAGPDVIEKARAASYLCAGLSYGRLDLERGRAVGEQGQEIAERLAHPDSAAVAHAMMALTSGLAGDLERGEQYAELSWTMALRGQDAYWRAVSAVYPSVMWPWRNDRAWIGRWQERYSDFRRTSHVERYDRPALGFAALVAALSGRPTEAREALHRAEELAARQPTLWPHLIYFAGAAAEILGEWEQAHRLLSRALAASEAGRALASVVEASFYYGRFLLRTGDTAKAEAVLDRGHELAREKDSVVQELNLLPVLSELYVQTGRIEPAEQSLSRAREILAQPQPWRGLAAAAHRVEGLLATARRDWSTAERAFEQTLDAERQYGFVYNEAQILVPWAELSFQRGHPGDRDRGLERLAKALTIFERCAANRDIERVVGRRAALTVGSTAGTARRGSGRSVAGWEATGLTPREQEVAGLIVRGLTNRLIAEALVISEGTARVHVERILGKLGVHSRTQLAAWAADHGLASSSPR